MDSSLGGEGAENYRKGSKANSFRHSEIQVLRTGDDEATESTNSGDGKKNKRKSTRGGNIKKGNDFNRKKESDKACCENQCSLF